MHEKIELSCAESCPFGRNCREQVAKNNKNCMDKIIAETGQPNWSLEGGNTDPLQLYSEQWCEHGAVSNGEYNPEG